MQQVLNLSGLLLGNAFAEDNGCKRAVVGDHLASQLFEDRGFLAVSAQLALAQRQILTLFDLLAVKLAVAGRIRHLTAADVLCRVQHSKRQLAVLLSFRIDRQHSRNALRDGLGRHDDHLFLLGEMNRLLGSHDDVLVVRQHENDFRRNGIDSVQNIVGGRVHGLSALYDNVRAEVGKQGFETLTGRNGYKAKLLLCRNDHALLGRVCRALDYLGGVLLAHVFDLNGQQRTEFQTLLERLVRLVGVNVYLDDIIILDNNQRIADFVQDRAQTSNIACLVLAGCDELGAVGEGDVLVVDRSEVCGGLGRLCRNSTFLVDAAQRVQHALEDGDKAEAAGVNHACLFKHRILMNGFLKCGVALLDDRCQNLLCSERRLGLTQLDRVLCRNARYGQDGALSGLHNRLVGGVYALAQCKRECAAVGLVGLAQLFRHAAEQQRQDNTRVAARAAQQRGSGRVRRFGEGRLGELFHLSHCGTHRHGHIRAGIAVRYREYVQFVCLFLLFCNGECALDHHGPVQRTVDFLICHLSNSPKSNRAVARNKISVCLQTVTA